MLPSPTNPILCPESVLSMFGNSHHIRRGHNANVHPASRMKVIITGGGGFLGSQLCQKLLHRGALAGPSGKQEEIREIVLLDAVFHRPATDARVRQLSGNISDRETVFSAVGSDPATAIFHL